MGCPPGQNLFFPGIFRFNRPKASGDICKPINNYVGCVMKKGRKTGIALQTDMGDQRLVQNSPKYILAFMLLWPITHYTTTLGRESSLWLLAL